MDRRHPLPGEDDAVLQEDFGDTVLSFSPPPAGQGGVLRPLCCSAGSGLSCSGYFQRKFTVLL